MTRVKARVGPKGQAVIPKPVRDELGIRPGDIVYFSTHGRHAHLDKLTPASALEDWFNVLETAPGTSHIGPEDLKRLQDEQYELR